MECAQCTIFTKLRCTDCSSFVSACCFTFQVANTSRDWEKAALVSFMCSASRSALQTVGTAVSFVLYSHTHAWLIFLYARDLAGAVSKTRHNKVKTYKLQHAISNVKQTYITTAIKVARKWAALVRPWCLSVSRWLIPLTGLIPSIGWYGVTGCKLRVPA